MALTKDKKVTDRKLLDDGQIEVIEETTIYDDGVVVASRRDRRTIDVGDDVSQEDDLTRHAAQGVYSPERKAARDLIKNPPKAKDVSPDQR